MSPAAVAAKWERRLRREGLAPVDQRIRGRVVIRTQIIEFRPRYVPDPERLAAALEAWASGDASYFTDAGNALLSHAKTTGRIRCSVSKWPKVRALLFARICRELAEGARVAEIARRHGCSEDLAYLYLRPLYAALSETTPRGDDDDEHSADD